MVVSGSVRSALLGALVLVGCQKKEPPPAAAPVMAPVVAEAAATATRADDQKPEPEQNPCRFCSVDGDGRITGSWQKARCFPADVADVGYPASMATVEVVSGNQKGEVFVVTSEPGTFQLDAGYAGTLPANAKPDTW